MKRFLYHFIKIYVMTAIRFYFNKIEVRGIENLKGNGPFLLASNHQNAFMDGLLITAINSFSVHFLIRADLFKKPLIVALLKFCQLLPVYRIRDGFSSLAKNQQQFDECVRLFMNKESVLIFPEGNHGDTRKLRPLSKGFTRIAYEAEKQHPEMKLQVVPVGINYSHHSAFNSQVSIHYGMPIPVSKYYKEPIPIHSNLFKEQVDQELKKLITHIDDDSRYEEILEKLNASNPDYSNPVETNETIRKIEKGESIKPAERTTPLIYLLLYPLKPLAWLINLPVILGWRMFSKKIKDHVFITSLKFAYGISVVQAYYYVLMGIASIWVGWWTFLMYPFLLGSLKVLRKPV